ncbi:ATP-dependent DNA ligase [Mesorhizobium sp. 43Arga]
MARIAVPNAAQIGAWKALAAEVGKGRGVLSERFAEYQGNHDLLPRGLMLSVPPSMSATMTWRPPFGAPATRPGSGSKAIARRWSSTKNSTRIYTRNGHDWTAKYRDLVKGAAKKLGVQSAIIDGEIIVLDEAWLSDSAELRKAITRRQHACMSSPSTCCTTTAMIYAIWRSR